MKLKSWYTPKGMVILVLVSFAGFILFREHQSHILQNLPYIILLLCPLMHIFMHGSHESHGEHANKEKSESDAYQRGFEAGKKESQK